MLSLLVGAVQMTMQVVMRLLVLLLPRMVVMVVITSDLPGEDPLDAQLFHPGNNVRMEVGNDDVALDDVVPLGRFLLGPQLLLRPPQRPLLRPLMVLLLRRRRARVGPLLGIDRVRPARLQWCVVPLRPLLPLLQQRLDDVPVLHQEIVDGRWW